MNEVFLIGKIISNINFYFMINSKNISIACFKIETLDGQVVDIKLYDSLADFVYSKIKLGDLVFVYGCLNNKCVIGKKCKKL